ncbi:MAG: hypothetical protein VW235_10745 [Rhodospirillaceae bacterium]
MYISPPIVVSLILAAGVGAAAILKPVSIEPKTIPVEVSITTYRSLTAWARDQKKSMERQMTLDEAILELLKKDLLKPRLGGK